jgi:hypothetical protein
MPVEDTETGKELDFFDGNGKEKRFLTFSISETSVGDVLFLLTFANEKDLFPNATVGPSPIKEVGVTLLLRSNGKD